MDMRGRVRTSPERREEVLNEFEKSGLTGAQFAKLTGIKYQTFANWVQERRRKRTGGAPLTTDQVQGSTMEWLETVVQAAAQPASASSLVVRLSSGAQLEVSNSSQVALAAALLRAWEKLPC
jgi:transposase-like protein